MKNTDRPKHYTEEIGLTSGSLKALQEMIDQYEKKGYKKLIKIHSTKQSDFLVVLWLNKLKW